MTSAADPEPSLPSTRRLTSDAPDATPRYIARVGGLPGAARDDRRDVRAVAEAIDAVAAREVHRRERRGP